MGATGERSGRSRAGAIEGVVIVLIIVTFCVVTILSVAAVVFADTEPNTLVVVVAPLSAAVTTVVGWLFLKDHASGREENDEK